MSEGVVAVMKKRAFVSKARIPLLVMGALLSASVACASGKGLADGGITRSTRTLEHAGIERSYVLVAPSDVDPNRSYPLVLALHGGGGDGEGMCSIRGGVQELAGEEGFIVACPSGVENHWNDGREIENWRAHVEDVDDIGFLLVVIQEISTYFPVDPDRVFATGVSNGGKMSLRLACEASEVVNAVAPVIASLPADLDCQPTSPVSVLIMNGTEDPLVPWEGGQVHVFRTNLGEALSTPETVSFWVDHNGCDRTPERSIVEDTVVEDGSWIEIDRYRDCAGETVVVLYTINGGGHTWPGGPQYLPEFLIGSTNRDMHAGDTIWGFFEESSS